MTESTIAVLGLGEAGAAFAVDLVVAGAVVRGYDPAVTAPTGRILLNVPKEVPPEDFTERH